MPIAFAKFSRPILQCIFLMLMLLPMPHVGKHTFNDMKCEMKENPSPSYPCWIAWSTNGQWIATWNKQLPFIDIWEAYTGEHFMRLETHADVIAWYPDIKKANLVATVTTFDYQIHIWNVETGEEIQLYNYEDIWLAAFNEGELASLPDRLTTISWNAISSQVIVGSTSWIGVWDTVHDELYTLEQPASEQPPFTASWSPDGEYLALAGTRVSIYEAAPLRKVKDFSSQHYFMNAYRGLQSIDWSPDGRYIITDGISVPNAVIRVFEVETGNLTTIDSHTSPINAVAWSPTGGFIASAGGDDFLGYPADNAIRIWDAQTYDLVNEIEYEEPITSISWKPDGTQLAAVDSNGVVYILDIERP